MIAHLISIGNELTGGQTVDTNSPWLAHQLAAIGIRCTRHVTISDELEPITRALRESAGEADVIIVTGGLGPTPDDLTRDALAAAMGVELELHAESLALIDAFFRRRNRTMHPANRQQAMFPKGAEVIENAQGTAPGMFALLGRAQVFCLPGVPYEMKAMWEAGIRPRLTAGRTGGLVQERILRTYGMSESEVGQRIGDLMRRDRNPTVGTSANELIISIRVVAEAASAEACSAMIDADMAEVRTRLGDVVYGEGDETLATAVGRMLIARGLTISTAESCTGGMIAKRLTDIPGSSAYFRQGFVTYSNESKTALLGVPAELIAAKGAVSREVAEAMAANCRERAKTDFALAVTGIAGPTGGTAEKPVGLVFVALAGARATSAVGSSCIVKELRMGENLRREQVRDRSAKAAVNMVRVGMMRGRD